ncbi:MAG: NAD(P)H-hydrate epimerase [Planctomycetota bacterium]|nr:NAD(P)H-hydrate epimerase [Planctomycetota bacterium]
MAANPPNSDLAKGALPCAVVRELDRRAIEEHGIPGLLLMENAGRATAAALEKVLRAAKTTAEVVVLCGPGNNGGDGFVIARTLHNRGHAVRVVFVGPLSKLAELSEDTRTNARLWRDLGRPIMEVAGPSDLASLEVRLGAAGAIVDALFGTGLQRELRSPWSEVVTLANAATCPLVAVDVPSGLHGDTGEVLGAAIEADLTVTFVAPKPGFFVAQGPAHTGRVLVAEIGIPRAYLEAARAESS